MLSLGGGTSCQEEAGFEVIGAGVAKGIGGKF